MSKTIEKSEGDQINIRGVGEVTYAEYGNNDGNPIEDLGGLFNVFGGGQAGFKRMVNVTDKVRSFLTNDNHLYFQVNNNNMGGDPCNGIHKKVVIHYKDYVKKQEPKKEEKEEKEEKIINVSSNELYHNGGYAAYIAIDQYQNINNLNSCMNDAKLLEEFLSKQGL